MAAFLTGPDWYAAPGGSGDGGINTPMGLGSALANTSAITSGHTLYLRGGTYTGDFTNSLVGVTICAYPGEQPIIDGGLTVNGSDCTFEGIEIMYSGWTTRETAISGSNPADIPTGKNLMVYGPRTTMRRCTFHDLAGPGWWVAAQDGLMEECLSYNNGWIGPDRNHGHALYTQNQVGIKTIRRCVFPGGYSDWSIHSYSEGAALRGFTIEECVSIGKTLLFGGWLPFDDLMVERSVLWAGILRTGYSDVQNGAAILTDNILANGAMHTTSGQWTVMDETGTDTTIGNRVLTYGNLVIVFNQAQAASVIAPIAGTYRNCQNPAESATLAEGAALTMSGWTVAAPIAGAGPLTTWDSRFGVFLVT